MKLFIVPEMTLKVDQEKVTNLNENFRQNSNEMLIPTA